MTGLERGLWMAVGFGLLLLVYEARHLITKWDQIAALELKYKLDPAPEKEAGS